MAYLNESNKKDEVYKNGCICDDVLVKQNTGIHIVELFEETIIPKEIWYAEGWKKCPKCKANFIVNVCKKYLLHRNTDEKFQEIFETIDLYHNPIYNYYEI